MSENGCWDFDPVCEYCSRTFDDGVCFFAEVNNEPVCNICLYKECTEECKQGSDGNCII